MAKICEITGKSPMVGHSVSHSNVKTKRRQMPNLHTKRLVNPATGRLVSIRVSTRGLRTLAKWLREGKKVDITQLA
jgi:large subunit ribosomal protein L28